MLKKTVLELGGSDPFIVLADADRGRGRPRRRRRAADQQRPELHRRQALHRGGAGGRPLPRALPPELGRGAWAIRCRARPRSVPRRASTCATSSTCRSASRVKRGAGGSCGGEIPPGTGAFYPPTLLAAVDKGMPAFDEETFGPVAAVIRAKDEADAVRLANDSPYGLGASLWTPRPRDGGAARRADRGGRVFVNGRREVRPAPALRRDQALGLRPGALGVRHPRVREHQVGVDRTARRGGITHFRVSGAGTRRDPMRRARR